MGDLKIHRKLSVLNGKGKIFLMVDGENLGMVRQIVQNKKTLPPGDHSIWVKDILGFTSNTIQINISNNQTVEVDLECREYLVAGILVLAMISMILKTGFSFSHTMILNLILVFIWITYLIALVGFWRHKLYCIRLKK